MTESTPPLPNHQGKAKVLTENLCVLLMDEVDSLRRENFALKRRVGVSVYEKVADDAPVAHDLQEDNAGETRCASTVSSSALSQAPSVKMQRRRGRKDESEEFEDEELGQQRRQRLAKRGGMQVNEQEDEDGEEGKGKSMEQRRDSLIWASDDEDGSLSSTSSRLGYTGGRSCTGASSTMTLWSRGTTARPSHRRWSHLGASRRFDQTVCHPSNRWIGHFYSELPLTWLTTT